MHGRHEFTDWRAPYLVICSNESRQHTRQDFHERFCPVARRHPERPLSLPSINAGEIPRQNRARSLLREAASPGSPPPHRDSKV